MPEILRVRNISKTFGGVEALKDVNIHVEKGSITGLIGPNGSGKTTLFNVIAGFYKPDSGEVLFEDENIQGLLPRVKKRLVTYGFSAQADFQARDVALSGLSASYRAFYRGRDLGPVRRPIPGWHNVLNSLAAIAVGQELDLDFSAICRGLEEMTGVQRRFQIKEEMAGVTVIDDYGHHPNEIKAVLKTMAECYPERRRVVLFQPHRYTRTQALFNDFTTAFYQSDVLVVTEIYAASEPPIPGVQADKLAAAIQAHGHGNTRYVPGDVDLAALMVDEVREGDVVLTLGAGNIWQVGEELARKLRERSGEG